MFSSKKSPCGTALYNLIKKNNVYIFIPKEKKASYQIRLLLNYKQNVFRVSSSTVSSHLVASNSTNHSSVICSNRKLQCCNRPHQCCNPMQESSLPNNIRTITCRCSTSPLLMIVSCHICRFRVLYAELKRYLVYIIYPSSYDHLKLLMIVNSN